MGNLIQTITLERRDESGVVVEKKEQLGKSFLIGFINQLYTQCSGNAHTSQRTIQSYGIIGWTESRNHYNLRATSPGGDCAMDEIESTPKGHEIGIQVGMGTLPVSSWDRGLDNKYNPEIWRTNKYANITAGAQNRFTGLCADGSYMYALIQSNPAYIYKLNKTSLLTATAWLAPGNTYNYAAGLACDGSQIWSGGRTTASPYAKLYKMTTDGSLVATYAYSTSTFITGIAWDGKWLMVADDAASNNVHHVSPTSGAILDNLNPWGFASKYFDLSYYDNSLWLLSRIESGKYYAGLTVVKVNPTTGTYLWSTGTPVQGYSSDFIYPQALCVMPDGQIWVGEWTYWATVLAAYMYCMGTGSTSNLEFGATEVRNNLVASNPNAQYSVRRYFTNASVATMDINEVALYVGLRGECISRDVVVPAVFLPPNQVLKVEYVLAVTV